MADSQKQVLFARDASTVHRLLSDAEPQKDNLGNELYMSESVLLRPGEYISADEVPPYVLEAVKSGKADTLELMPESKAQKLSSEAAAIRREEASTVNVVGPGAETSVSDTHAAARSVSQASSSGKSK